MHFFWLSRLFHWIFASSTLVSMEFRYIFIRIVLFPFSIFRSFIVFILFFCRMSSQFHSNIFPIENVIEWWFLNFDMYLHHLTADYWNCIQKRGWKRAQSGVFWLINTIGETRTVRFLPFTIFGKPFHTKKMLRKKCVFQK